MNSDFGFDGTSGARAFFATLLIVFVVGIIVLSEFSLTGLQVADTVPPSGFVTSNKISYSVGEEVKFEATANDNIGVVKIEIYVDNKLANSCISTPCKFVTSFSSSGRHTYYSKSYDAAGNIGIFPPQAPKVPKLFTVSGTGVSSSSKQVKVDDRKSGITKRAPLYVKIQNQRCLANTVCTIKWVASSKKGSIKTYDIDFGDGVKETYGAGKVLYSYSTKHTYANEGTYELMLNVFSTANEKVEANAVIRVSRGPGGSGSSGSSGDSGSSGVLFCEPLDFPAVQPSPGCVWEYDKAENGCIIGRHQVCSQPQDETPTQQTSGCDWRPASGPGCTVIQPNAFYFDGKSCRTFSGCSTDGVPFKSLEDCQAVCGPR